MSGSRLSDQGDSQPLVSVKIRLSPRLHIRNERDKNGGSQLIVC